MPTAGGKLRRTAAYASAAAAHDAVFSVLKTPDLLPDVFRVDPAGEKSIRALHAWKLVCKTWLAAARHVLADAQWLAPFLAAAEAFLRLVPELKAQNDTTALIQGMQTYRSRASVQEAGCRALSDLSDDEETEMAIAGAGGH